MIGQPDETLVILLPFVTRGEIIRCDFLGEGLKAESIDRETVSE